MTTYQATLMDGPANPRRRPILNLLAALCCVGAVLMLGKSCWITMKAEVAQVLLNRAFAESVATGHAVKPWSWADTWPVAEVRVARIGATAIVLHGATPESMAFGPALLAESAKPGERGTTVIAAHRDTHFRFLRDVKLGDVVEVTRSDGLTFHYKVTGERVAPWNHSGISLHAPGRNLVLATCYPFDAITHGPERYIVEAVMME